MTNKLSNYALTLFACLGLTLSITACGDSSGDDDVGDDDEASGTEDTTESDSGTETETGSDDGETGTTTEGETDVGETDTTEETAGDLPNGAACTSDGECMSANCYVVPFLGGQCGECNEDADCDAGGCTAPNPFESNGSTCNMGELGGGCESSDVCEDGLTCGNVLDLLGLIQINTCGNCETDDMCTDDQICAPLVSVEEFSGVNDCIDPGTLEQDAFCNLEGNGDNACASGICSTIDIMGLAEVGACGQCNSDDDCAGDTCVAGEFVLDSGMLVGSTCQ
ncbi:hypothetical protein G6O69_07795 [Pseudenhygromyxa sp. WMMC2535]|uniref:hypothetical protein n=1 Tax=Pseudenhygromyxa sp. WMMC2535 TaxID=2712867 RepID=UPI001551E380|nr:hypothetical protein [Pseudenhygromyxa sp. WMMC2535]NVB37732.1 hypothetical protein [Pseudenhygromyxa sp. WMMC2535]